MSWKTGSKCAATFILGVLATAVASPRVALLAAADDRIEEAYWIVRWCREYQDVMTVIVAVAAIVLIWRPARQQVDSNPSSDENTSAIAPASSDRVSRPARTLVEKERARNAWYERVDQLIRGPSVSSRDAARKWRDEVLVAFQNYLADPSDMIDRFSRCVATLDTGGEVKNAVQKGIRFLKDRKNTIREVDLL